ncbi:hypothetical protein KHP62_13655 [Rhodobacteraceae bacterium NNCM2]|nr:hypothetical protein [Coraliihabitans acroporae]
MNIHDVAKQSGYRAELVARVAEPVGYHVAEDGTLHYLRPFIDDVADAAMVDYVVACPIVIALGFQIDDAGYLRRARSVVRNIQTPS